MTVTIENFLKINLDLSGSGVVTQQYTTTNDLSNNNILNLYLFLNTEITKKDITITVEEFDKSNVVQHTHSYIMNYEERHLNKTVKLSTVTTLISINYISS
jgi:hypothetical protein